MMKALRMERSVAEWRPEDLYMKHMGSEYSLDGSRQIGRVKVMQRKGAQRRKSGRKECVAGDN